MRRRLSLDSVLLALQATAYLLIAGVIGAQIVCRKLFNSPLAFPEELVVLLLVAAAFWGVVAVEREGSHLRVETLWERLPRVVRRGVDLLSQFLALGFVAVLIAGELQLLPAAVKLTTPAAGIPVVVLHAAILLACLLWLIVILLRLTRSLGLWRSAP